VTTAAIPPVEVTPAAINATFAMHTGHIVLLLWMGLAGSGRPGSSLIMREM
jgi:hypothetical protein